MLADIIEALLRKREGLLSELLPYPVDREILLHTLSSLPGVVVEGEGYRVVDPLALAVHGLRRGVYFRRIAGLVDWRDFEKVSMEVLAAHGYIVYHSVAASKPRRFEIDVVGIDTGSWRAIVIDCKHWRHGLSPSMLVDVARKHVERTVKLLRYRDWLRSKYPLIPRIREAVPMIVTLRTPRLRIVDGRVLVLGFHELDNVLRDLYLVMDTLGARPITVEEALDTPPVFRDAGPD